MDGPHSERTLSHVQSIKSVSAHTIPPPNTTGTNNPRAPTTLDASAETQSAKSGEGLVVPEHVEYSSDLQNGISMMKKRAALEIEDPGIRQKVISSLDQAKDSMMKVVNKGQLKKGKRIDRTNVNDANVVLGKRSRNLSPVSEGTLKSYNGKGKTMSNKKIGRVSKVEKFKVGDTITASSKLFDGDEPGSYSSAHPQLQIGSVVKNWSSKGVVQVKWIDGTKSYQKAEDLTLQKRKDVAAYLVVVMMMMAAGPKKESDPNDKSLLPKDFFQAMCKPDWREWVAAVKKEIESWLVFNAYSEIPFKDRKPGSSIVPLGELFTRKRDGSHKFRQYLMSNLLKQGKDFETFSACISWDGIRWSAAVACATGKEIRGLDAVTGFLQAREQFDLYAFIPSHGHYSNLSYEDLAVLRLKLLDLVKRDGEQGLKKFAAAHKRESRVSPKTCYKLNSSIYGAPSANHEWEMLFQDAHVNKCGLTLSEVEPSLFVKLKVDDEDNVVEWMICSIWTDDVRYFGTKEVRN